MPLRRVQLVVFEPELRVRPFRRRVVGQHLQRELARSPLFCHLLHFRHHRLDQARAAMLRVHEYVVHVDQRLTLERAEPLEAVYQTRGDAVDGGDHGEGAGGLRERRAQRSVHVVGQRAGVAVRVPRVPVEQVHDSLGVDRVLVVRQVRLHRRHGVARCDDPTAKSFARSLQPSIK